MIEKAVAAWTSAGYADPGFGPRKIAELLDGPYTEPARVQSLVADASYLVELHRANPSSKRPRPLGKLITGLGLASDPDRPGRFKPPAEVPLVAAQQWAKNEADALNTAQAVAAAQARINALRDSGALGVGPTPSHATPHKPATG